MKLQLDNKAVITVNPPGNVCDNCNYKYQLEATNTVVYYFDKQPWFSYGQTLCPKCCAPARLFWRDTHTEHLEHFILCNFGFITEDYADTDTVLAFENVYGVRPLAEHELTPRLADEIQRFADLLSVIPDICLMDMMEMPQHSDRPEQWAD